MWLEYTHNILLVVLKMTFDDSDSNLEYGEYFKSNKYIIY